MAAHMTPTICGHRRDVLIAQLRCMTANGETGLRFASHAWKILDTGDTATQEATAHEFKATFDALNDPAKLAELLAVAMADRGVNAEFYKYGVEHAHGSVFVRIWHGFANGMIQVSLGETLRSLARMITLSQARATLLRILELPEGATAEDAVKALAEQRA